jgi:hypothetical protein
MTFKIYSTYGGPATMNLSAWIPVSDSGLNVTFSHSHLVVQERSQVNTTIVIIANPDAKPGIYRVNLADTLNNNVNNSDSGATGCYVTTVFSSYDGCLDVTVAGNGSDWFISNTSGSGVEYGGRFAPPWFSASVETDKDVYRQGEPIKLSVHITNNGNRTLTLPVRDSDVIIHFYDRAVSFPVAFHPPSVQIPIIFEIRANGASNSNQTIVLAPHSSKLLVREFVWDQKTYDVDYVRNYVTNIKNVPPGKYYLVAELDLPNVGGVEFTQKAITVSS